VGYPLDYVYLEGRRYIRATTPYLAKDFRDNTGMSRLPAMHEVNEAGFLISHYLDGED
jgi:lysine 2,3-aminomutase